MIIGDGIVLGASGESASIIVTGLSETDSVSASKDGKTVVGKWGQIPNSTFVVIPDGYTQLQYIESTGTQYIDTGVIAKDITDSFIDFQFVSTGDTELEVMATYVDGSNRLQCGWNGTSFQIAFGATYSQTSSPTARTTAEVVPVGSPAYNVYLFAQNEKGTAVKWYSSAKIYACRISTSAGLVRDFVPAKRNSDSVIGLYDLVNDVFYTNSGTGVFIAGAEVPQTIEGFLIDKIKDYGTWTVTATDGTKTATSRVVIDSAVDYIVPLQFGVLYEYGKMNIPLSFSVTSTSGQIVDTGAALDIQYARGQNIGNYNSYAEAVIYTDNAIDLTSYSTLYVSGVNIVYGRNLSVYYDNSENVILPTNNKGAKRDGLLSPASQSGYVKSNVEFTHSADISGITSGRLYIRSLCDNQNGGGDNIHLTISKIWLE